MIEPEASFYNLEDVLQLCERLVKLQVLFASDMHKDDLLFFDRRLLMVQKGPEAVAERDKDPEAYDETHRSTNWKDMSLHHRLRLLMSQMWPRITYETAIHLLNERMPMEKKIQWGESLSTEHEKFLAEEIFCGAVFVTHYPASIKPFYMKINTLMATPTPVVNNFDLLVPGIGELAGGSERVDNYQEIWSVLLPWCYVVSHTFCLQHKDPRGGSQREGVRVVL